MLDSVVLQVFLEECKYVKRKNKMFSYINDDLEMTSSDEDDYFNSESDNDSDNYRFLFSLCFFYNFFDVLSNFLVLLL